MKYKLGDFVRFVDENYEGYVTRIIDEQMIGVTGNDDFEIPVLASKVTFVHGHQAQQNAAGAGSSVITAANTVASAFQEKGIYLGVAPDKKASSVVHFYLINETSYQLLTALYSQKDKQVKGEYAGTIAPKTFTKVYSAQLADIQLWPQFTLQVLLYAAQLATQPQPLTFTEKFRAKDFADTKKTLPLLNEAGWLIRLDEPELTIDPQQLKESFFKPAVEKIEVKKPQSEVDLHIEKLNPDYEQLNGSEILNLQLTYFKKALDAAIVHQLPEITFIHGAGNGILRNELQKQLGRNQKVKTFMDARKEKFGYGATKVILK
ncbi:hypothetical protein GCM10027037_05000 [Mucilaginibacter koreensis]